MSLRNGAGPAPAATGGEARKNVGSGNARSSKAHSQNPQAPSWRNVLPVHPAAELFPLMSPEELRDLGADIRKNELTMPIVLWKGDRTYVLDGRCLDGIEVAYGSAVQALLPAIVTTDSNSLAAATR